MGQAVHTCLIHDRVEHCTIYLSYLAPSSGTFHSWRDSLLFGKNIVNALRYNARARPGRALGPRLEGYLRTNSRKGNSNLIPKGAHTIRVSNVLKIGGGFWSDIFSISLTYTDGETPQNRNVILKTYLENIDPVLKAYIHNEDLRKCVREFQALRSLGRIGFPVPEVYLCECDSRFIGYPFIIMQKEEVVQKSINEIVDCFAATLANLHNLNVSELGINVVRAPADMLGFARRWPIHFKEYLNLETKHDKRLKEDFNLALRWLNSNMSKNPCPKYCLLHGDYHPGNVCVTKDSRMIVLDWDSIEIGDPAHDVGYAYHFVKFFSDPKNPNSAEKIAERFISEYSRNFKGDISGRLEFYKMVGILGTSIYYSSGLSNPIYAYKYHQRKILPTFPYLSGLLILLGFPFIRWHVVARQLAAEGDILWLQYFEDFLKETLKR
jgi:aminoglycoside phosphotransferase (APT) family kinase protein